MDTFIFDLDGTLLPMPSQELFLNAYFKALSKKFTVHGIDQQKLMKALWVGIDAMINNNGEMSNADRFWQVFCPLMGEDYNKLEPLFDHFYRNEFSEARETTYTNPNAALCISLLKEKGYKLALATNPVFPQVATYNRIQWAGLNPEDFKLITTYENSTYCKPNIKYYEEILAKLDKKAEECIMVGNDVKEDMCVIRLGMDSYLLNECLINTENSDISNLKQGSFEDLLKMIKELPDIK